MIYVASPYSHDDPAVRQLRFEQVRDWTFNRIKMTEESLFSPITYCHNYAVSDGLPLNHEFWEKFACGFLSKAEKMYVLMLPGWEISKGITLELLLAQEYNLPVEYFLPDIGF